MGLRPETDADDDQRDGCLGRDPVEVELGLGESADEHGESERPVQGVHPAQDDESPDDHDEEGRQSHHPCRRQDLDLRIRRLEPDGEPVGVPPSQACAEPRVGAPHGQRVLEPVESLEDRVELVARPHLVPDHEGDPGQRRHGEQQHELGASPVASGAQHDDDERGDEADESLPGLGDEDGRDEDGEHRECELGGPSHPRRADIGDGGSDGADRPDEVLVHVVRPRHVDLAEVAGDVLLGRLDEGDEGEQQDRAHEERQSEPSGTGPSDRPPHDECPRDEEPGMDPFHRVRHVRVVHDGEEGRELVAGVEPQQGPHGCGVRPLTEGEGGNRGRGEGHVRHRQLDATHGHPGHEDEQGDAEQGDEARGDRRDAESEDTHRTHRCEPRVARDEEADSHEHREEDGETEGQLGTSTKARVPPHLGSTRIGPRARVDMRARAAARRSPGRTTLRTAAPTTCPARATCHPREPKCLRR